MESLAPGFYIAHVFRLGRLLIRHPAFERRDTLVNYHRVFRYTPLGLPEYRGWYNEFGSAVVFQPIIAHDAPEALALYESDFPFAQLYHDAVRAVRRAHPAAPENSDFSFLLEVGATRTAVSWNTVSLAAEGIHEISVLLEALFVYHLCNQVEHQLNDIHGTRRSIVSQRIFLEYTETLFNLERPQHFLINKSEIALMEQFYANWDIGQYVHLLRERVEQSITNYSFYLSHREKRSASLMNLLLTAIAILSVQQVVPTLVEVFPATNARIVNRLLTAIAITLLMWAATRYLIVEGCATLLHLYRNATVSRHLRGLGVGTARKASRRKGRDAATAPEASQLVSPPVE